MAQFISDRQVLASAREKTKYQPFVPVVEGILRTEMPMSSGHPLYVSMSSIFSLENETEMPLIYPVLPTGCAWMIFYAEGEEEKGVLYSTSDSIKKLTLQPHKRYLCFRFTPGSCAAFLTAPMGEIGNKTVDVAKAIKNGSRLLKIAARDLPVDGQSILMSRVLRVEAGVKEIDYLIRYCTTTIYNEKGNVTVADLAAGAGFSERYIGMVFEKYIGLSPKTYAEIIRFQHTLNTVEKEKNKSLLDIALDCGYFDQPHMNRAFKRFIKCTSGIYRKEGLGAIDFSDVEEMLNK